ncbi:MAG: ABC transporter permease subunit [Magnetococcales bacterium]|nr:ABC transporter permease subunit [Magnetococcales bacterium]
MRALMAIAKREWRSMFISPLAWALLAVLMAINAFMFNAALQNYVMQQVQFQAYRGMDGGQSITQWIVAPTFGNAAVLLLLLMPLITMRLLADEKRRNTWEALASSPVTPMQIVLGKYLGLLFFIATTLLLLALLPLSLYFYGSPDTGQVLSGLLGLFLVSAAFGAVGLATSSATKNPMVAAVTGFGVLLLLWIISWMGKAGGEGIEPVLNYLSIMQHYERFLMGVITSADLVYFLLVIAGGLLFARQRLLADRIAA